LPNLNVSKSLTSEKNAAVPVLTKIPLIYKLLKQDLLDAYNGFEYKNRKYPGVGKIIEDLKWTLDMNIWGISRENYLNNGVVNIKGW